MDIACPTCAASYEIDDGSIGDAGRKVRCAECGTIWRAWRDRLSETISVPDNVRPEDVPLIESAPPLAPTEQDIAYAPAPSTEQEPAATAAVPPPGRRAKLIKTVKARASGPGLMAKLMSWPVLVIIMTLLVLGGGISQRERVVRLVPQSATLFAALGLPVNLRGIDIRDVKSRMVEDNGVNVLVIDGNLVSVSRERMVVPRLRFAVLGDKGQEIFVWSAQADRPSLQPGENLNFRRRLAAPPADGRDVSVRFLTASDITAGLK